MKLPSGVSFKDVLRQVREVAIGAYSHQDIPFERLLDDVAPRRSLNRTPLFQVFFNMLDMNSNMSFALPGLNVKSFPQADTPPKFDLSLDAATLKDSIHIGLFFDRDLYEHETVSKMVQHFCALLESAVADPDLDISRLHLLTASERNEISALRNSIVLSNPFAEFELEDIEHSIPVRFEDQVRKHRNRIAVRTHEDEWTYETLNYKANLVARRIIDLQCDTDVVGLLLGHDAAMVAALLGVLKTGKAYMPMDPNHPLDRLAYMVDEARAEVIVTDEAHLEVARRLSRQSRIVLSDAPPCSPIEDIGVEINPEALAYILYTSGSTGRPKGVMQCHRNVLAHIRNYTNSLHLGCADVLTLFSSYCFDAAVMDIFGALLNGATLCPVDVTETPVTLIEKLAGFGVTVYHSTPTVYRYLTGYVTDEEQLGKIRLVVLGGEEASKRDVESFKKNFSSECVFINGLGPTESTVSFQYFINKDTKLMGNRVPVGYPADGVEILLLDDAGNETEVYGEIAIRSDCLALGYLNRPDLTSAAFYHDCEEGGKRIYRTGDMGRLLADGSVGFLGRKDLQTKIRGYRIELEEIEAALVRYPLIVEAAVAAIDQGEGEKLLAAYIVVEPGNNVDTTEIRRYLMASLPDYMAPSWFIRLPQLPLTSNGKLDRKALPTPQPVEASSEETARTPVEEIVAGIWRNVLRVERVGREENFFELGGHSLLATQVVSRIREALGAELPLRTLFESPTVQGLALEVEREAGRRVERRPMEPVNRKEALPLSHAQQRLWFIQQLDPDSTAYNVAMAVRLEGALDIASLKQSLTEIARRHEVLRTRFVAPAGQPVQVIDDIRELELPLWDMSRLREGERDERVRAFVRCEAERPFDLERGPVWRGGLVRMGVRDHVLALSLHHVVSDLWSMGVLVKELATIFEANREGEPSRLPELPVQYADFAVWQRKWLQGEVLEEQLDYWKKQLTGAPVLELPTDRPRRADATHAGATVPFKLSGALTEQLKELSRREGVTLFMTLLAAFQMVMGRLAGEEDVAVGTDIANRNRLETEGMIGFFVNQLVLRTNTSGNPTFRELLRRVRGTVLNAYAHQDVPFERVVEEIAPAREANRSPLFQIKLVLQNVPIERVWASGLSIRAFESSTLKSKFDILLNLTETDEGLAGWNTYDTDLFDAATMGGLIRFYQAALSTIAAEDNLLDLPKSSLLSAISKEGGRLLTKPADFAAFGGRRAELALSS